MGWENLVEIMAKVHEGDPEVSFEILGENPEINPDDFPNVSTLSLKQNDMPAHQARARCAAFTTSPNLIPHSLLGAMALGKTVVAFDLEGLHEVIQDGESGYLIPGNDTGAFAERILKLTSSPVNPEIGTRARQNVIEKCDFRLVAGQYEALFERAAG
jgi:glycosyltransferase involved in cell wall biosynthesis